MPKSLYTDNTQLTKNKKFTFLSLDASSGATAIAVQSTIGFNSLTTSSGQIICIGEIGNEKSEILRSSQTTAPGGVSVTLRDAMQFDHPQDTKVYVIDYNRVEFNSATTATGTKSTLLAYPINIQADQKETIQYDTSLSSGFYFARFNNTIESQNSDWSDAIPFAGYADNTVLAIKRRALDSVDEEIGELITHDFLDKALWEGRREYHQAPGKRPFRRKFGTDIGNVTTGMYRIVLPEDVEKPHTAENVYGVRIGVEANLTYYDKKEWDFDFSNKPHSTLTATYTVGARDLYLADARDFASSGAVSINGTGISYSEKSNTGGTLRISADGSWGSDGTTDDVWQNISYGLPYKFTVFGTPGGSAYIYFNTPVDTAYVGQNIYSDYYRTLVDLDSDADTLDEPNYDMYVNYLSYRIKKKKDRGLITTADEDFQQWFSKKNTALASEHLSADVRIFPDLSHLD